MDILLNKSLQNNHNIEPLDRISYFSQEEYTDDLYFKWSTFQKLHCLITASPKVHNKSYHYSRFFLNKQLNKLVICNTLK